jgi:hypothetical protein
VNQCLGLCGCKLYIRFLRMDIYDLILHVKSSLIIKSNGGGVISLFSTEHLLTGTPPLIILLLLVETQILVDAALFPVQLIPYSPPWL